MSEQESADMVEDGYTQLKPQLASHLLVPVFLLIILAFPQFAWNVLDIIIIIIIQVSSIVSKVRFNLFPPSPITSSASSTTKNKVSSST